MKQLWRRLTGNLASANRELESGDYTAQRLAEHLAEATGDAGNVAALGAVETAVGMIERAFASVAITPPVPALSPVFLALLGRSACLHGELMALLTVERGRVGLLPAHAGYVRGSADPESWTYSLTLPGPSDSVVRLAPAAGVLHFRWNCHASSPWRGRSPLRLARLTAQTAAAAERSIAEDLRIPNVRVYNYQGARTQEQAGVLAESLNQSGGRIRTQSGRSGSGPEDLGRTVSIGPDPAAGVVSTRIAAAVEVASALGIPPALLDPQAAGQGQRESYRRFVLLTVDPMLKTVQDELRVKLDMPELTLSTNDLAATDLVSRAKTAKALVDAGFTLGEAAAAAGVMTSGGG